MKHTLCLELWIYVFLEMGCKIYSYLCMEVDYNDFQSSLSGRCVVRLVDKSRDIISYEIYPPVVECIVEDLR